MARSISLIAGLCLLQGISLTYGSVITFQSSPANLIQGLTTTMTLQCALSDTAASGSVIGKRDVTQTKENMLLVTSLVLMKDGKDLASVNSALAAHMMNGSTNVQVSGSVAGKSGQRGFLELTFTDPNLNETGEFACEINAVNLSGHVVTFSATVEVSSSTPSLADLVSYVGALSRKNAGLESKVDVLEKDNAVLKSTVAELKNKSEQMVFFNARIHHDLHLQSLQTVVFDDVLDNFGTSYNIVDGQFTCTVPGYYYFSLGCLSGPIHGFRMDLDHNGKRVFEIYASAGTDYQAAANSATLHLAKGDVAKIVVHEESWLEGYFCNFSGHLIRAT